jgi:ribosomal protein S18 acetylase RimI-like enzyme
MPVLRRARAIDRGAVVRALARAFDADPVINYVLRQDDRRAFAFELFFDVAFRTLSLPHDEAWVAEDGAGAALWTPPGKWSDFTLVRSIHHLVRAVGVRRSPRIFRALDRVGHLHPTQSHWYLFAIGVDPDRQGRGIGGALLDAVLTRCDASGTPAYLEASSPHNVRLYERKGFRITDEIRMANDAPPLWPMWRDARRGSAGG